MPTKDELLAYKKNNVEMCEYIKAKSLKFLSLIWPLQGFNRMERNNIYPQFSDHYFTGDYPIKPTDNLERLKGKATFIIKWKI